MDRTLLNAKYAYKNCYLKHFLQTFKEYTKADIAVKNPYHIYVRNK